MNYKYYKVKEVAEFLSIAKSKVYELIYTGDIGFLKIGGTYRISDHHLENYIKKNSYRAKPKKPF